MYSSSGCCVERARKTNDGNVRYTSNLTQNESIGIAEMLLINDIPAAANKSTAFSMPADETTVFQGYSSSHLEFAL